jgi:alpha-L-rhamnosidase
LQSAGLKVKIIEIRKEMGNIMGLTLKEILVEYQKSPIGLDETKPRFSWTMVSEETNVVQTKCQIKVCHATGDMFWDSGILKTNQSTGIEYEGTPLSPCTAYKVVVRVWDNYNNLAEAETAFETGFFDETIDAWEGAQWICAPRYTVAADTRGIFLAESEFRLEEGSKRAGIIFGANDYRLLDSNLNEYGIQGENYIRYEINLSQDIPKLDIYRVGYAREDRGDKPLASVDIVNYHGENKTAVINDKNKYDFHKLKVKVLGNNAFAYVDEILVDAVSVNLFYGPAEKGRLLNPRGYTDVITYPRLNEIGFFAGNGDKAYFKNYSVSNIRKPGAIFIKETPGGNLYGENSIFNDKAETEKDCFVVESRQITADPSNTSIPMFRTQVRAEGKIKSARLYITSRGIYDCMINGKSLTNRVLAPGITQYDKRINYQTYDITKWVNTGKNGIGVTLASGWWSDSQTFNLSNYNYFGDKEAFLAKIIIQYEDGTRQVTVTDVDNWSYYGNGPYRYAGLFQGEHYDGRKAFIYRDYSKPDFNALDWERPLVYETVEIEEFSDMPPGFGRVWPAVNKTETKLLGEYDAPVYVVGSRSAKTVKKQCDQVYIYDLEQEMAGVSSIVFHETAGTKITIRYGEVLYPDRAESGDNTGRIMAENYRDASSTDIYICCGDVSGETYQPKFTFHGYRYIEISGVTTPPALSEVKSLQYSSITEYEGTFACSNETLNRFTENVKWSQLCNFINIPTDCPQRNERMGWAGDTHIFCSTAIKNAHLKLFYERNIQAMVDLQEEDGRFPEIAPIGGGFGGITYECAPIFMTWELYRQYGDTKTIKKFYLSLKKYMDYIKDKGLPGKADFGVIGPLADWLAQEETDPMLMWNAFYYKEAELMSKLAACIKEEKDSISYLELAGKIKTYWNDTFIAPDTKIAMAIDGKVNDTQCAYALALAFGIVEDVKAAGGHLSRKTKEVDYKVTTGFFGTGVLNKALTETGHVKDAYKLMLQTGFPSWLYPVTQGATTIWERWDSYTEDKGFNGQNAMNSFNHYSLGSVLSWIYECILGIRNEESHPGMSQILLQPHIQELDFARGSISTQYGVVSCGWKREKEEIIYTCELPVNMTAQVSLPGKEVVEIGSGKHEFLISRNK